MITAYKKGKTNTAWFTPLPVALLSSQNKYKTTKNHLNGNIVPPAHAINPAKLQQNGFNNNNKNLCILTPY